MTQTSGVTLVELMVVILILALIMSVVPFAWSPARTVRDELRSTLERAINSGTPQVLEQRDSTAGWVRVIRILPDGRILAPGVDPVLGLGND